MNPRKLLLYKARGPVEPGDGDPREPAGALKLVGHVLHGATPPYGKYAVYVDELGTIWARLHQSISERMRILFTSAD